MKSTQNIYNKLFSKQNLASQRKVKFALIDEIDSAVREAELNMADAKSGYEKNITTMENLRTQLTMLIDVNEYISLLEGHLSTTEEMRAKLEDAMTALGLAINDSPQHERLLFIEAELSKAISDLEEQAQGELADYINIM